MHVIHDITHNPKPPPPPTHTSVPIAAVLSRLDAVFLLAFATLVYGPATPNTQTPPTTDPPTITTRLRPLWPAANALLLLLAALLAAFTRDPRLPVEHGDWAPVGPADGSDRLPSPKGSAFLALGAILAALTQLATRAGLQRVPVGLLVTARMLGAFLLFHPMALAYGGPPALRAIYHPRLWLTMLWCVRFGFVCWVWVGGYHTHTHTISRPMITPTALKSNTQVRPRLRVAARLRLAAHHQGLPPALHRLWPSGFPCFGAPLGPRADPPGAWGVKSRMGTGVERENLLALPLSHPTQYPNAPTPQPLTFGESIAAGLCLTAGLSALTERWYRGGGEVGGGWLNVCVCCL